MLERWRERDVFAESVRRRRDSPKWGFYEGPPTANGPPGIHHVLSRVFKDIFPRYRTMCGCFVERKGGWDCHGLPVELAMEEELGFTSKDDIERFGIAEFNARCREKVLSHVEDWNRLTERIGFWIDLDDAYRTLDPAYVESVWWALKTIHDKGLLYEKLKVVPYCPRDQVDAVEPRARAARRLSRRDRPVDLRPLPGSSTRDTPCITGDELLIWTTTPWTLVSNAAVAVDPELTYVRASARDDDHVYVLAEARVEAVLGEGAASSTASPARGHRGARLRRRPSAFIPVSAYGAEGSHRPVRGLRHRDRRHRPRAHRDRLRRGRLPPRRAVRPERDQPGPARRHLRRADRSVRRSPRQGRRPGPHRGPETARPHPQGRDDGALLSALLALRHAAALLRQAVVVHRDQPAQGSAARRQRDRHLVSRPRQARPLRQLARAQRRLGALARALLGHAAAGVAVQERALPGDRLAERAQRARRHGPHRPPPAVRGRRDVRVRGVRASRCDACPR